MSFEHDYDERLVTGRSGRLFVLLTVAYIAIRLTQRLFPPLLPAIIDDLGITAFYAGVALTVLRITRAGMQYPAGRFSDRLSRTSILIPSLGVAVLGLAMLSISRSYGAFLAALVLFGIGLGSYDPASRALLSDLFREKRGRAFGLFLMGGDVAGIIAAGLAIWIVAVATWRGAFLPLLVLLLPVSLLLYSTSPEPLELSAVDLGIRATVRRILSDSRIRWLVLVYSCFNLSISGVGAFLPTFLIQVHGFSFALASSAFALLYAVGIVVKPIAGVASDRFPRLLVVTAGLALGAGGLALLVTGPVRAVAIGGVVVYAIGYASVPPSLQAYLMDRFPEDNLGGDFGAVRTTYMAVGSVGPAYVGFVATAVGFVPAFSSIIALLLIGGGILLWVSRFG